jgi:hypothetical protein
MYSADFLKQYARDRISEAQAYAARQHRVPSFRRRLAYKLEALAHWLEPELKAPRRDPRPVLKRAF